MEKGKLLSCALVGLAELGLGVDKVHGHEQLRGGCRCIAGSGRRSGRTGSCPARERGPDSVDWSESKHWSGRSGLTQRQKLENFWLSAVSAHRRPKVRRLLLARRTDTE